jgi:paraquat-inducible protein B
MSKANPAVIGGFVVGAIALIVIGLLVFGGTSWFVQRNQYVAYFPGSVKGLQVGAPVDFRGVTIGRVTGIKVLFDPEQVSAQIPVIMEFDPRQIVTTTPEPTRSLRQDAHRLIEAGLRAQLQSQNSCSNAPATSPASCPG